MKRGCLLLLLLVLMFASCAKDDGFEAGEALSAEETKALREELLREINEEKPIPSDGVCYFTESGSVYHLDPDCSYLSGAKKILTGTVEEAKARGILRGCSRCANENEVGD